MKRILKFPIEIIGADVEGKHTIEMPKGAEFVSVIEQNGKITLYAICDMNNEYQEVEVMVIGTGSNISDKDLEDFNELAGTVKVDKYVWHVFFAPEE